MLKTLDLDLDLNLDLHLDLDLHLLTLTLTLRKWAYIIRPGLGRGLMLRLGGECLGLGLGLGFAISLGGGVVGSVLVATPGSVHSTFIELQLLVIPQHHIHTLSRP